MSSDAIGWDHVIVVPDARVNIRVASVSSIVLECSQPMDHPSSSSTNQALMSFE